MTDEQCPACGGGRAHPPLTPVFLRCPDPFHQTPPNQPSVAPPGEERPSADEVRGILKGDRCEHSYRNPLESCPDCLRARAEAAELHSVQLEQAVKWLLSDDTGLSSEAILAHMLGIERKGWRAAYPPRDEADRGRCVRLLERFPEWQGRLDELLALNDDWADQIPLIRSALSPSPSEGAE